MKSAYIIIIIIVLAGLGFLLLGNNNKLEAPATTEGSEVIVTPGETEATSNILGGTVTGGVNVSTASVKEFTITGKNFAFAPSTITVNKGDRVRLIFKNQEGMHDWVVDEFSARTPVIKTGETETIEFTADKTGSFEYYCSVGQHRANGMKGTLVVK